MLKTNCFIVFFIFFTTSFFGQNKDLETGVYKVKLENIDLKSISGNVKISAHDTIGNIIESDTILINGLVLNRLYLINISMKGYYNYSKFIKLKNDLTVDTIYLEKIETNFYYYAQLDTNVSIDSLKNELNYVINSLLTNERKEICVSINVSRNNFSVFNNYFIYTFEKILNSFINEQQINDNSYKNKILLNVHINEDNQNSIRIESKE